MPLPHLSQGETCCTARRLWRCGGVADGKAILKALQEILVERQMTAYLATQHP
jgi:hypothetical protein